MSTYANSTTVTVDKSQAEIERTLMRYGATGFARGWDQEKAYLAFQVNGRHIRFIVNMPGRDDFKHTPSTRKLRSDKAQYEAWEQACRQRWRALALVVKAKLEAIQAGISTFEDEFMAFIMLPNGQTVGQAMKPQIEHAYQTGEMPPLLGSGN